ncbi:MAG: hypothetical protein GY767_03760 [Shimia sp.]|nr:hypothetical protein [Shimia sp.]MCP4824772.1 hypothetical protein [Shimia sp.]|mmetsp:Transcript_28013/g.52330  ORF Transcript_28013/g.52330 Transcript_28013/m.52330 type:complete len:95 (-) Transcript_28013:567-851(-)|eukprot:CAMPEP_0184439730 /NCGR_PEP_ID=MMETSP0738-20130409/727421_1 /TAXON_ID=385413 /ORGANISM="Thalassiosira miniscula, Strain CCMP1093" /LENGTH=94 /DNA_ID=CAMNT_0026807461 /DNA_START=212 /DNA_END=496 /DNA_ORIENTATION=+
MTDRNDNSTIVMLNMAGVALAYVLLGISLWLSTDVPLSTKGYWGMGIVLLTISLINVVKYRFDNQQRDERIRRIEEVRDEKMLEEALLDTKPSV